MMPREKIVGALARGYCTKENENKVLDPTLIEAMANEVEKVLEDALKRAEGVKGEVIATEIVKLVERVNGTVLSPRCIEAVHDLMKNKQ